MTPKPLATAMVFLGSLFLMAIVYNHHQETLTRIIYQPNNAEGSLQQNHITVVGSSSESLSSFCPKFLQVVKQKIQKCLIDQLLIGGKDDSVYNKINPAMRSCSVWLEKTLRIRQVYNRDDVKYLILPVNYDPANPNATECSTLTIGIGADIKAEREIQKLFPKCQFLGVDPVYEAGIVYEELGPFVHAAIGPENNGTMEASVFKDEWYVMKNVTTIHFDTVLAKTLQHNKNKIIDFLFMDAEGAEYNVIPFLTREHLAGREICQISTELHGLSPAYHTSETKFREMFINLLKNGDFLPIIHGQEAPNFNRMYWLNFGAPKCVEKYLSNYCDSE